jgi:C1A family cysteine protease
MVKQQQPELFTDLSRLFVYYNARAIEGNVDTDYGVVYIRNALKGIKQYGICTEEIWPYDISKFAIRPTDVAYDDGVKRKISGYTSIPSIAEMLEVLNNESPIIIGMDIFENFLSVNKANPVVAKPDTTDFDIGGHAVAVIGYSIPKQQFLIKNSFGDDWGDAGYGWLTFEYVKDYAFDKWFFTV